MSPSLIDQTTMAGIKNPYAPQYHFAPEQGWINDPNGMVYFNDTWHLFYQFYDKTQVDGMQWGHAISTDLVHWEHLPPAIAPDKHGQIWSGSAVVDFRDSSGLFNGGSGMVCLFTYWDKEDHRQSQGLAYSADGFTFQVYEGNPIIPQLRYLDGHSDDKNFRDPKVFWHGPSKKWVMVVAGGLLRIFTSTDLIHWHFESIDNSINTECPDLFELPIDGDPKNTTWLLSLGGQAYYLGDFDGRRFTPRSERLPMSAGPDFYAGQSFSDAPQQRRIMMSWIFRWAYAQAAKETDAFPCGGQTGGCLTVPYELSLVSTKNGPRLVQQPVAEYETLWQTALRKDRVSLTQNQDLILSQCGKAADLAFIIQAGARGCVGVRIPIKAGASISCGYNADNGTLFIDRRQSGYDCVDQYAELFECEVAVAAGSALNVRILIDKSSVELFADDGKHHMAVFALIDSDDMDLNLYTTESAEMTDLELKRLALT